MADERIDIEINDKIDDGIPKKLRDIAAGATAGESAVQRLKSELSSVNDTPTRRLKEATDGVTGSLKNALNAQKGVGSEMDAMAARANKLKAAIDPLAAAQQRFDAEMNEAKTLLQAGAINMRTYVNAVQVASEKMNTANALHNAYNGGMAATGKTAKLTGFQLANLSAQFQDIGVSLASGQPLWRVLIQQGSQISYIASTMEGGFKALTVAAWNMLAPFLPIVAAVGALYLGFKKFTDSMASEHKAELDKYANSLGLTSKEMRKLGDETVSASGKLKSFDTITITMADSWNGFWATVKEGLGSFSDEFGAVTNFVGQVWDKVTHFLYEAFIGFYGAVVGGMRAIATIIAHLPTVTGNTVLAIVNATIASIEWLVNKAIDGINGFTGPIAGLLQSFGVNVGNIGHVSFGRFAQSGKSAMGIIADSVNGAMGEADRTLTAFGKRWDANSLKAAKARIKNAADAIIDDRNPKAAHKTADPKTQGDYINDVNSQLDNELSRMHMLKDAREEQQRLDQIEEEFIKRRMPLDAAQIKVFKDKIHAISEYKYVQAEMDRIYEGAVGPQRTYNASMQAAKELLDQGAISADRYNQEVVKAGRALAEATDPLFAMKEAMDTATVAATKYGVEVDRNNYYEQIRQSYLKQGTVLSQSYVAGVNAEVDALMKKNDALLQQQYIQSQVGSIVNPILDDAKFVNNKEAFYAEIDKLRQQDVLNEQQAQQAKYAIQAKYDEIRLRGASQFFGTLAQLSSSGNKKLAAIGKAAAIAQATIDGFVAVQKALASGPPPWNIINAAAVAAMTGVQVAGIISTNVGGFANGGSFMVDGKAGVDNNNISMAVSKGERVTIETPAQQRANAGGNGGNGGVPDVHVKNIVQFDPRNMIDAMDTAEGEHVLMTIVERRSADIKKVLGS